MIAAFRAWLRPADPRETRREVPQAVREAAIAAANWFLDHELVTTVRRVHA